MNASPNIILVHGAWADGLSWSAVIERLQADSYNVTAASVGPPATVDARAQRQPATPSPPTGSCGGAPSAAIRSRARATCAGSSPRSRS